MKKVLVLLYIFLYSCCLAQNPHGWDTAWVRSFGGQWMDEGKDIKETGDKGFIIAGTSSTFGSGNTSFYIIKTDSLGIYQWSRVLGTELNDFCYSVEVAGDGSFFFSGLSNNDIQKGYDGYVIKTDSQGNQLWTKNYGGNDWDFFYNSCLMPDGGLLLCGETSSGGMGGTDGYLVRTDANGDTLWTKRMGGPDDDTFYSVEQLGNRIYVVGKVSDTASHKAAASIYKLDLLGNELKHDFLFDADSDLVYLDLSLTSNGQILLCGKKGNNLLGNPVLAKMDTTGLNFIFNIPISQNFHLRSIIEGYYNDVYVLGLATGGLGGYAANFIRYTSGLVYLKNGTFGGVKDEEGAEIIKTSKGYAFVGSTSSYGNTIDNNYKNVYLVVFNRIELQNDFFVILNEFYDNLPLAGITEQSALLTKTSVYPNPANSVFTIQFPEASLEGQTLKYQLIDLSGRTVDESFMTVTNGRIVSNTKGLQSGIYLYRLSQNSRTISNGKITID